MCHPPPTLNKADEEMTRKRITLVAGLLLLQFILFPVEKVSSQGLSTDGARLISLSATGKDRANSVVFSPDGKFIAAGTSAGIYLFDSQTLSKIQFIPTGAWVRTLAISSDGTSLLAGLFDENAQIFSFPEFRPKHQFENLGGLVRSVAFTPDGRLAAVAAGDMVRLWNVSDGSLQLSIQDLEGVRALAISPDGVTLAVGLQNNSIQLRALSDGTLLKTLVGHEGWIRCLAFSPDGTQLASGAFDATARLWDVQSGELQHTLTNHQSSVLGIAFSPDGTRLATGSVDQTVRLWNSRDGALLSTFVGHASFVYTVAFSPDGLTLASGANDNTIRLWDLNAPVDTSVQPPDTPSDCRICHHPTKNSSPVAVIDVRCDACHPNGLGVNWCPFFPRSSDETRKMEIQTAAHEQIGFPVPGRSLGITISAPANGEVVYSNSSYVAPLQVTGMVESTNLPFEQVELHLEVWDETQMVSSLSGVPKSNGQFAFNLGVNPAGHMLRINDPAAPFNCAYCHDDYPVQTRLPAGELTLRVIATTPDGDQASDERRITTDVNKTLLQKVTAKDVNSGETIDGLIIQASTRLYEWRDRTSSAATEDGVASLSLEALTRAPTSYKIQAPDQVINGVFYSSSEIAELTIEPEATSLTPLTLKVRSQSGQISGTLSSNSNTPLTVWAIQVPGGPALQTQTDPEGLFSFTNIPVARYAVFADSAMLARQRLLGSQTIIDLTQSPTGSLTLDTSPIVKSFAGTIEGQNAEWLPFAWILAPDGAVLASDIRSGSWLVNSVSGETQSWTIIVPGYYSQKLESPEKAATLVLMPRPDLQQMGWGVGEVSIPPETLAKATPGTIDFDSGWIWGSNSGNSALVINTEAAEIDLSSGQFALDRTAGGIAWFYLFAGHAELHIRQTGAILSLQPGQMIALSNTSAFTAFPYEPEVALAVNSVAIVPVPAVWEPGRVEKLQASTMQIGVIFAQLVTFITYFVAVISLVGIPWLTVRWFYKHPNISGERNDGK